MIYLIDEICDDMSQKVELIMTHDVLEDHLDMMLSDFVRASKVNMVKVISGVTWEATIDLEILYKTHPKIALRVLTHAPAGNPLAIDDMTYRLLMPDCYGDC